MTFDLYVKAEGRWRRVRRIEAASHAEALREAIASLRPEHYGCPIRLEPADPQCPPAPPTNYLRGETASDGPTGTSPQG